MFMSYILGKKVHMTQIWKGDRVVPVTVVKAEPNSITQVRTVEKDGYEAVQVALSKKTKREFRVPPAEAKKGDSITVGSFEVGDKVRVSGYAKGRGFQGVVKRHGFHGGPKTHGQKNRFRAPGSIGSTAPQRVFPGRRMAGHMGTNRVTYKNVEVAQVDAEKHLLYLKGGVPGAPGGLIEIQKVATKKK